MVGNELHQTLFIMPRHVTKQVNAPLGFQIAGLMRPLHQFLFFRHRLKINHRHVAALGKITRFIEHVGHTA